MSFLLVPKSVTLNDLERRKIILRYFTEFGSFRGALPKSGWQKSHNYGQFTITMSSSKRLQTGPRDAHGINIL